jgi:hypothetical protein
MIRTALVGNSAGCAQSGWVIKAKQPPRIEMANRRDLSDNFFML